jgi:hypothetical protein
MTPLEAAVLKLLSEVWNGAAFRLRKTPLAAALDRPVDDIRRALTLLRDGGKIAFERSRGRGGPHVLLLRPPAEPKPTRLGNFKPLPQP